MPPPGFIKHCMVHNFVVHKVVYLFYGFFEEKSNQMAARMMRRVSR